MKQTGRTMVEMLAVLAIAGVLTLGGISGIRSAINMGRQMLTEGFYHDIRFSMIEKCMGSGSCPYQDYRTGFSAARKTGCFPVWSPQPRYEPSARKK